MIHVASNGLVSRRRSLTLHVLVIAAVVFLFGFPKAADAQETNFPSKPIHLVVPFAPGGIADFLGRVMAQALEGSFGVPVVVENRAGASSNIGSEYVSSAKPDGYTILLGASNMVVNVSLYKDFRLKPAEDLTPISLVANVPNVLVIHPSVPARSVAELVTLLKAKPDSLSVGSSGEGSPAHLAAVQFQLLTGTSMLHVPYGRGAGASIMDLLAGRIEVLFANLPPTLSHIQSGKLLALATTSPDRLVALPEIPTMEQAGVKGFDHDSWYGILAPRGTPAYVVEKLGAEVTRILARKDIQERFRANGATPRSSTPVEFSSLINQEILQYADFIKRAKIAAN
jgi:tripartite-type tricarboxylate transporter receptor subunit TctC